MGLIYFNSCDKLISDWFSPPDSAFLLDSIRPDFLLLRTVARNLIMWKYVLPTQKWIISQLSTILKSNLKSDSVLNAKFCSLISESSSTVSKKPKLKVEKTKLTESKMPNLSTMKKSMSKNNLKLEAIINSSDSTASDSDTLHDDGFDVNTDEDDNVLVNKVKLF